MSESRPTGIEALLVTEKRSDGSYSSTTLPMWAGIYLRKAEALFGPRDSSYCFLGIDFHGPNLPPRNWFPDSGFLYDDGEPRYRHIIIHLAANAIRNLDLAKWQLAHECVHLLDPWNEQENHGPTNILEEGLATWYQCRSVPDTGFLPPNYAEAKELVTKYEEFLPDAVKSIRANERGSSEKPMRIGTISPEVFIRYCPQMDEADAVRLCERFA